MSTASKAFSVGAKGGIVKRNLIIDTAVGIEFNCNPGTTSDNTISSAMTGLDHVPGTFGGSNSTFNVVTVRTDC